MEARGQYRVGGVRMRQGPASVERAVGVSGVLTVEVTAVLMSWVPLVRKGKSQKDPLEGSGHLCGITC